MVLRTSILMILYYYIERRTSLEIQDQESSKELLSEFESGQKTLVNLEVKQINLRNTMLRVSGAMQVLEEE
jgi:hypothetical protein